MKEIVKDNKRTFPLLHELYSGLGPDGAEGKHEWNVGINKRKRIMRELIEKKIKDAEARFDQLKGELNKVEESQQKVTAARQQLTEELTRLQGEYRGFQTLLKECSSATADGEVSGSGPTEGQAGSSKGNADGNGNGGKEGGRILEAAPRLSK